jgi:hypothetical protein
MIPCPQSLPPSRVTPASSQLPDSSSQLDWSVVETGSKKRRILKPIGRPPKASTIDPDFGAIHSFVSQAESTSNSGDTPPSPIIPSELFVDCSPSVVNATQAD